MQCPKCNHPINDTATHCMYCGAATGDIVLPASSAAPDTVDGVRARQSEPFNPDDGSASQVLQVEDGMSSEGCEVVIETSDTVSVSEETDRPAPVALSLEKTVAMLATMKNLLDSGRFDATVYEHMTLDAVKDYLSTMTDSAQLIFVSYEIQDSALGPFLTQAMIDTLRMSVMDTIAQR